MQFENDNLESVKPGLVDRLMTAVLAPIAFGVPTLIILIMMMGSYEFRFIRRRLWHFDVPVVAILLSIFAVPFVVGFILGMNRFSTLYGHFFYTNQGDERDLRKTIAVWLCLLLIAFGLSNILE